MISSDIQTDNNRRHHGFNELEIMDQILRRIGSINNYEDFVASVIDELKRQTSCDQVVSIFSDASGHIYDCKLQGVSSGWGTAYQKYYSKIQGEFDFGYDKGRSNMEKFLPIRQIRWQDFEPNEFIRDCVIMRGG